MIRSRLDRSFLRFRRHGDPRALAAVFDRAAPELWKVAACLCRDRHAVEDAVQGTFLTAIEARDDWDETRPVLPWLLGLLVNRVRTESRRQRREPDAARAVAPRGERDPAELAAAGELHESLRTALRELPEPYRSALEQHLVGQRSATELASEHGLSTGAMRMRLHRALDQLRRRLPASLGAVPAALPLTQASRTAMRAAVLRDSLLMPPTLAHGVASFALLPWLALPAAALLVVAFVLGRGSTAASPQAPTLAASVAGDIPAEHDPAAGAGGGVAAVLDPRGGIPVERERVVTTGKLRVVVVKQDDGSPVVGARVDVMPRQRVAALPDAPAADVPTAVAQPDTVVAGGVRNGTTDATGVASFEVAAGLVVVRLNVPELPQREVTIVAGRESQCRFDVPVRVVADVTVVDGAGRPVPAARILGRKAVYLGALDEIELGRTGEDGRWAATFVEDSVLVRAVRAGDAASDVALLAARQERATLRLGAPAATVRGRVLALDGEPLPGAGVAIRSPASRVPLIVRAGDDGAFVCDYVSPGSCQVYAWHGEDEQQRFAVVDVEATANAAVHADVRFARGASIVAEVRRPDGSSIFGASVLATPERRLGAGFNLGRSARTGGEGCRIEGLLPGRYELRVHVGNDMRKETVDLVEGQQYRLAVEFDVGATVDLEIVDAKGAALAGWWVGVVAADLEPAEHHGGVSSLTDSRGRARLRGVPARRLLATVRKTEGGIAVLTEEVEPAGPTRLVVIDACDAAIRGVLVPAAGQPLTGLRLSIQRMPDPMRPTRFDPGDQIDAAVAADGSFTFGSLPAGRYAFGAVDRDTKRIVCWRMDVELHAGEVVDLGSIETTPGTIRVLASRDDGRAVEDLHVSLGRRGDGAFGGFGAVGYSGSAMRDLAPAEYEVLVWGADIAPTRAPVTLAPGAEVELPVTARAATPVTFRCVDLQDSATWGTVRVRRSGTDLVAYLLPTAGTPHTRGLLPGRYEFEFQGGRGGGLGRWVAEFEVGSAPLTVDAVRTP